MPKNAPIIINTIDEMGIIFVNCDIIIFHQKNIRLDNLILKN